jgi:NAD(P)-dependent dehydrogenase (short-subunit alcohol dehydrogenase family)
VNLHDLTGRVAMVTGGAGGIGRAIALSLAEAGADVIITARAVDGEAPAAKTVRELTEIGRGAAAVALDVLSRDSIKRAVAEASDHFGTIDVLVNNAGTNVQQRALDVDEETWDLILDTNLKGTFFVSQEIARRMVSEAAEDREFAIVNVASQMGFVGWQYRAAYCSSKAGVVNLTRALAVEWAKYGIRVNSVAPTFIHTPLGDKMLEDPELRTEVLRQMPLERIGEPEDVAEAVRYLAAPTARLVTGHTLVVDGGWTAW